MAWTSSFDNVSTTPLIYGKNSNERSNTIVGGILGCGLATVGIHGINLSLHSGVSQMFALWTISPLASGAFGAIIFLFVKYGIMKRAKPVKVALVFLPFFYTVSGAMLTSNCSPTAALLTLFLATNIGSAHNLERSRSSLSSPQALVCRPHYPPHSGTCDCLWTFICPRTPPVPLSTSHSGRLETQMASLFPRSVFATKRSIST